MVLYTTMYIIITRINSSEHRNGVHLLLWIEKPQSKYGRFELIIVIGNLALFHYLAAIVETQGLHRLKMWNQVWQARLPGSVRLNPLPWQHPR